MKKSVILLKDFDRYTEEWLELRLQLNHQPSSVESTAKDIRLFSRFCHERHIRRITGKIIVRYVKYLRNERQNGSGAINRKQSSLRMYIKHLRLRQVEGAAHFPAEFIPRARDPYQGPIKTLERNEVRSLLTSIDSSTVLGFRDLFLFTLQYALGLRLGEALAITLHDIDLRKKLLTIHGKGRRERTLPLVDHLVTLARDYLQRRTALRNSQSNNALFLSKKGQRLSLRAAEENFQKLVKKHGPFSIERVVPHTLRHSFASHALETESQLIIIKAILGHARMQTTEIYLHPSMDMLRKSVNDHLSTDILAELRKSSPNKFRIQARTTGTG